MYPSLSTPLSPTLSLSLSIISLLSLYIYIKHIPLHRPPAGTRAARLPSLRRPAQIAA